VLTAIDKSIFDNMDYLPFGEQIAGDGGSALKFIGKERDGESGLDNFGARYDSSSMGRFMSVDWAASPASVPYADFTDPQSLNLYSYGRNRPLAYIDRDGHCIFGLDTIYCVAAGVAAAIALTAYAYHHFTKTTDKGDDQARKARTAHQESTDATIRGDAQTADKKDEEYNDAAKAALKTAAEATAEGVQLPGTSTGGDIGFKPEDGATAVVTTVVTEAAKKSLEKAQHRAEEKEKRKEEERRKKKAEEEERKKHCGGGEYGQAGTACKDADPVVP